MDLNSAVQFSPYDSSGNTGDIRKMIDEYRIKSQDMSYSDQRMGYGYNDNVEEELRAAYDQTSLLEDDRRKLLTISDVLLEQVEDYEK